MNLLLVSRGDIFPPIHGAAVRIYQTLKYLSFYLDRVIFASDDNLYYYWVKNGKFIKSSYPFEYQIAKRFSKANYQEIINKGIPHYEVRLYRPLIDRNLKLRVDYLVKKYDIDIIQSEFPGYVEATTSVCKRKKCPIILVEHNVEFESIKQIAKLRDNRFLKSFELDICRRVDAIVTVSQNDRGTLVKNGILKKKITVIPHGVDLTCFQKPKKRVQIRKKLHFNNGDFIVFFHGSLDYPPNRYSVKFIVDKLLPALRKKSLEAKALIVGRNPPHELKREGVVFTNWVKNLAPYINCADAAIVYIQSGGGMRMKILEYFADRLPVISTKKGMEGIPVKSGRHYLQAETLEEFVDAVFKILKSQEARKKLTDEAYNFVSSYDWEKVLKKYIGLYKKLIS